MSQLGYYSPGILGALAAVVYAVFGAGDWSTTNRVIIAAIGVPSMGLTGQLLMLSAQGVFAGVLPVPFGRTIRGRKCAGIGMLVLFSMVFGAVAYLASRTETGRLTFVFGAAGSACGLIALGMYGWALPTASAEFSEPESG